jgi:hypothetical protein
MWMLSVVARALEPGERAVVLGDIAESGEGFVAAACDLLGLIVRRQAAIWADWRPWLALLGVAGLAGVPLSRIVFGLNAGIGLQLRTYSKYGVWYDTGVTTQQEIVCVLCTAIALMAWSWACGFVLGSLSGRAVWITWYLFYQVVLHATWARFVLSGDIFLKDPRPLRLLILLAVPLPLSPASIPLFLSSLLGALHGASRRALSVSGAYLTCVVVVSLTILTFWTGGWHETAREVWSGGLWHGSAWVTRLPPFLFISWPAAWLVATAQRETA